MREIIISSSELCMYCAWILFLFTWAIGNKRTGIASIIIAITSIVIYSIIGMTEDVGDAKTILLINSITIIASTSILRKKELL